MLLIVEKPSSGLGLGLETGFWASRLRFGPSLHQTEIWALMLEFGLFGPRGWDLSSRISSESPEKH